MFGYGKSTLTKLTDPGQAKLVCCIIWSEKKVWLWTSKHGLGDGKSKIMGFDFYCKEGLHDHKWARYNLDKELSGLEFTPLIMIYNVFWVPNDAQIARLQSEKDILNVRWWQNGPKHMQKINAEIHACNILILKWYRMKLQEKRPLKS